MLFLVGNLQMNYETFFLDDHKQKLSQRWYTTLWFPYQWHLFCCGVHKCTSVTKLGR